VQNALDIGYRLMDTSGDYGSQPGIGQALKASALKRDEFYVVTKVEDYENAYESVRKSLQELQLDFADLVLIHYPPRTGDAGEDLWNGLLRARDDGYVKDIGVSNYSTKLIDELIAAAGEIPAVNQIEWSPFGYSRNMYDYCREKEILIQAYSPITRKLRLNDGPLNEVAKRYKKTPAQIILRWNIQMRTVPLPKASQKSHLKENFDVFDFELSDDDMVKVSSFNERYSSLNTWNYV
jgi:diketogulonate reductase-like aldo/keto reductase